MNINSVKFSFEKVAKVDFKDFKLLGHLLFGTLENFQSRMHVGANYYR